MKKFFSLVLALVMALSLTTVAWGVDVDNTNAQSTLHAAGEDLVLNLTGDITSKLVVDWRTTDEGYTTPTQPSGVGYLVYPMKRTMGDLTIQGSGTTKFAGLTFISGLTNYDGVSGAGGDHVTADACYIIDTLTFAKVKITEKVDLATGGAGRAVINELVFDHVTFDVASDICAYIGSGFVKNVTFKYCTFNDVSKAAIEVTGAASDINVTVDNCEFNGPARGILLSSDGYTGDISVTNNKFAVTDRAIRITDLGAGASLEIQDNKVTALGSDNEAMKLDSIDSTATIENWNNTYPAGAKLLVGSAESAALADIGSGVTTDANGKFTGGTFYTDVSDNVADGYVFVNGEVAKSTPAGNTTTYDVKDLTVTNPAGVKQDTTGITSVIKVASVTNTSTVNGVTTTTFVPAYYQVADGTSAYTFVECDKSVATYMFTIKGVGSVYVREMAVPAAFDATPAALYTAPKTATCGKVGANEDVYVVVNGKYYATDYTVVPGAESYALVNGKLVVYYGEASAKGHNWLQATKESYDTKTGAITSVKCPDCKGVVAVYAKAGSFDGKEYVKITEGVATNYYYVAGAVATAPAGTTTGPVVESAETFDAGIAMYVGMSVMAAAGSAVVLKKKD